MYYIESMRINATVRQKIDLKYPNACTGKNERINNSHKHRPTYGPFELRGREGGRESRVK